MRRVLNTLKSHFTKLVFVVFLTASTFFGDLGGTTVVSNDVRQPDPPAVVTRPSSPPEATLPLVPSRLGSCEIIQNLTWTSLYYDFLCHQKPFVLRNMAVLDGRRRSESAPGPMVDGFPEFVVRNAPGRSWDEFPEFQSADEYTNTVTTAFNSGAGARVFEAHLCPRGRVRIDPRGLCVGWHFHAPSNELGRFVLQLHGFKQWEVGGPESGPPRCVFVVGPGDVLFLPEQTWHATHCLTEQCESLFTHIACDRRHHEMHGIGKCNASKTIKNATILRMLYKRPPFEPMYFHESFDVGRALMSGMIPGFLSTESVWSDEVRRAYRSVSGGEPPPEADRPTQYREWHSHLDTSHGV